jgi:hypothetical protein
MRRYEVQVRPNSIPPEAKRRVSVYLTPYASGIRLDISVNWT